ncbi:hypothetical protein ACEPAH_4215 [Sanghuangporus vaninii]
MRKLGTLARPDVDREMSFESPVTLDLPYFYEPRKDHALCGQVYRDVFTRVNSEWTDPRVGTLTVGRWSNNWMEFDDIGSWTQPLSRWDPLDRDFLEESGCTVQTFEIDFRSSERSYPFSMKLAITPKSYFVIIDHQEAIRGIPLESSEIESWSDEHWKRNLEMLPEIDSFDDDDTDDGDEC